MSEATSKEDAIKGLKNETGSGIVDPGLAERVLIEMKQQNESPLDYTWTSHLPTALVPQLQTLLRCTFHPCLALLKSESSS